MKTERHIIEPDQLEEKLQYWQHVLDLDHWDIVAKIKRRADMGEENQGDCNWVFIDRVAIISLLSPIDWDNNDFEQDMEKTLVHELLHCKFDELEATEKTEKFIHRLLNDMARSLVYANRHQPAESVDINITGALTGVAELDGKFVKAYLEGRKRGV